MEDWENKYKLLQKGLGVALDEFHNVFPAGLGFDGDCILNLLRHLHNETSPTSWHSEVMKMIEEAEKEK